MPENIALYVLLVVALGIGYLLGRREWRSRPRDLGMVAEDYFKGLNHLLNERHDLAIDTFVESMAVDNDTVDTHLALGSLVRRRGEVDKAIRIHQNLLARPVLSADHRTQTELELARDYLVAGLLGRAENLLKELAEKNGREKQVAHELLLEIYQREREWEKAVEIGIEVAKAGVNKAGVNKAGVNKAGVNKAGKGTKHNGSDTTIRSQLAHFQCELAELALAEGDLRGTRAALGKANGFDAQCPRTPLLAARTAFSEGRYKEVQRQLVRARDLDPEIAQQTLDLYQSASDELNDHAGFVAYLKACLDRVPALPVIERLAADLEQTDGAEVANEFVVEQLLRNPSLGGFVTLLNRLDQHERPLPADQLTLVRRFSQSLLQRQPEYRCKNCGFSGKTLMWQCPSCRTWGTIKPIIQAQREDT